MAKKKKLPPIDLMPPAPKEGALSRQERRGYAHSMAIGRLTPRNALSVKATGMLAADDPDVGKVISSPKDLGRISGKPKQPTEFEVPKGTPRLDFSGPDFWSNKYDFKKNRGKEDPEFRKALEELGPNPRFFEAPPAYKGMSKPTRWPPWTKKKKRSK